MNIVATALLLVITLLVVPIISYFTGTSLGTLEWAALQSVCWVMLAAWITCFTLGELTENVSQVDKVWSLLPIVYTWVVAAHGEFQPRWKWTLFNLGFISGYQNVLIMLMTLPTIVALQFSETPLGWPDGSTSPPRKR